MFNKYAFSLAAGCQLATGANQVESGTVCIMFTAAGEKIIPLIPACCKGAAVRQIKLVNCQPDLRRNAPDRPFPPCLQYGFAFFVISKLGDINFIVRILGRGRT